jgi:alkanesulfonate monooxygenase SsuD/methylene tetrahydromethanopterin reductase-like flavin-dependent oxidoreductase (luciferase family)
MNRQLHLNLFIHSRGHHEASWRHRGSSPLPLTDIRYYQDLAQRAETALFDSLFLADQLAWAAMWRRRPVPGSSRSPYWRRWQRRPPGSG